MKYFSLILLLTCLCLSACSNIYSNYREVEQLLVVETIGFDASGDEVSVSLSSGLQSSENPGKSCLSGTGNSIGSALENARNFSFEDELFCYQASTVLIGEDAARRDIEPYLSYICQSPMLRTDLPVFLLSNATAHDSIFFSGDASHGVSEILQGITHYLEAQGGGHIFRASDLIRAQERCKSALVYVLSLQPASELTSSSSDNTSDEQTGETVTTTLAVSGFGIVKDYRLIHTINMAESLGLCVLINQVGTHPITISDSENKPVVLEVYDGHSSVTPRWEDSGVLKGLDINAQVKASVAELSNKSDLNREAYTDALTAALEKNLSLQISETLRLCTKLQSDFLALSTRVEESAPLLFRHLNNDFDEILPGLDFRVTVSAQLFHPNELKENIS